MVNTSCTAMNGPYPPVVTPKVPNIRVAHTVYVTSTDNLQETKSNEQHHGKPQQSRLADNTSNVPLKETCKPEIHTRTSAFAESLDQPPTRSKSKLEPRIEPPGAAYRWQGPDRTNPEIGIISFLCEYPRARTQNIEPRKNLLQNLLLRSKSERRLLFGSKQKMPAAIALKRTSDGRRYSQIVTKGLYEEGINKSTYQVNVVDSSSKISSKRRLRGKKLGDDMVEDVKKRGLIESLRSDGESPVITSDQMADSKNTSLTDGQKREAELQQEWNRGQQKRECSPTPLLPLQGAAESTFGVDFSSILNKHDESMTSPKKPKRAPLSTILMTRSESRPNVRDFAGEEGANFLKSAFRHRSKSPIRTDPTQADRTIQRPLKKSPLKKLNKQRDVGNEFPTLPPTSHEEPDRSIYTHSINSIHDSVTRNADLVESVSLVEMKPDKQRRWSTTEPQEQSAKSWGQQFSGSSDAKGLSTRKGHLKSLSGISGGSNDNDNLSEVSSAIISDAQSISIHKPKGDPDWSNGILAGKPHRPGPAPTAPLPSLPEGHHVQLPSTPGDSESSQRRPSPQRSPTKQRQKVPVKYRLTPAEQSPAKKSPSPTHVSTVTKPEQMNRKPAALLRIQTANVDAFPSPPLLSPENNSRQTMAVVFHDKPPTSVSAGVLAARAERTKKLKAKHFAKERSKTVTSADESYASKPTMRTNPVSIEDSDGHEDSIERLINSYDTQQILHGHGPQPLPMSTFSASDADNRHSMRSSEFSPIIIVANQEPVVPPESLSVKAPSSESTNDSGKPSAGTEIHFVSFSGGAAEPLDSRPASEYSLQPPQPPDKSPRRSRANRSPHKSVVNRTPTPFTHPSLLRRDSYRSSQRSSLMKRDLEARMVAIEKKHRLLERAFHTVIDASASISSGDHSLGRDSGHSFGTGDRFRGSANDGFDQFSGDAMVGDDSDDKPSAGWEDLLARQGRRRLKTLSTSSEPC